MLKLNNNCESQTDAELKAVYENWKVLQRYRTLLRNVGLTQEDLPDDVSMQAFALLGVHDRHAVEAEFGRIRSAIDSKGLVPLIEPIPTPLMRLMLHVAPLWDSVQSLWDRLKDSEQAPQTSPEHLRCVSRVRGMWGQQARVHFAVWDTAHVLIRPAPVFGTQPTMLTVARDGRCNGSFTIPIDDGAVTLTLALRNGDLRCHHIDVSIGQPF